jgi:hypothetical protein
VTSDCIRYVYFDDSEVVVLGDRVAFAASDYARREAQARREGSAEQSAEYQAALGAMFIDWSSRGIIGQGGNPEAVRELVAAAGHVDRIVREFASDAEDLILKDGVIEYTNEREMVCDLIGAARSLRAALAKLVDDPPTLDKIAGIDPEFTGKLTNEEYIRSIRGDSTNHGESND